MHVWYVVQDCILLEMSALLRLYGLMCLNSGLCCIMYIHEIIIHSIYYINKINLANIRKSRLSNGLTINRQINNVIHTSTIFVL